VPPLRERKEDLPLLAGYFLRQKAPGKEFTPEAVAALLNYDYPGNVRELLNMVERGALLAEGNCITPEDLFQDGSNHKPKDELLTLAEMEKRHIDHVLQATSWNKVKTAEILGISVRNLYRKIETYGLQ